MLYFSDLDRTLIYSKKFLKEDLKEVPIEKYEGEYISFMTEKSINLLKDINKKNIFIPCTTRSIEQYERIEFKKYNINFPFAIVCNGGYILKNGIFLKEWDDILKKELKKNESFLNVRKEFTKNESIPGILKVRQVYQLFFYIVVDYSIFNKENLLSFEKYLIKNNWETHYSGRKIYFLPQNLKKENAAKFLANFLGYEDFFALGDSSMDLNLLKNSKKAYIPKNSFLMNIEGVNKNIFIPSEEGLKGLEEILENIDI